MPVNPLKVRCPKCRAVFMLAGRAERVASVVAPAPKPAPPAFEATTPIIERARPVVAPLAGMETAAQAAQAVRSAPSAVADSAPVAPEVESTPAAREPVRIPEVELPASPARSRGGKSAEDRARRLARVLVSDILWYNRERRDAALRDGTLVTSLSEEIKKSWELYKEKVGAEAAQSTNYFKEALNEILADGQQVF